MCSCALLYSHLKIKSKHKICQAEVFYLSRKQDYFSNAFLLVHLSMLNFKTRDLDTEALRNEINVTV